MTDRDNVANIQESLQIHPETILHLLENTNRQPNSNSPATIYLVLAVD